MFQITHLMNTLRPELHLWEHTPGRSTDLFRLKKQTKVT